jgi:hypothetical protein
MDNQWMCKYEDEVGTDTYYFSPKHERYFKEDTSGLILKVDPAEVPQAVITYFRELMEELD